MFETEQFWLDAETKRWVAEDRTWGLVTSGTTREAAQRNLEAVRTLHLQHVPKQ